MTSRSDENVHPARSQAGKSVLRLTGALTILLLATGLAGCAEQSMGDLKTYSKRILARPGRPPKPLPLIEPYVLYTYSSSDAVDPFQPFYVAAPEAAQEDRNSADNGIRPDRDRNREELEAHPLDALRMMGTLVRDGETWGIIRSPDAVIHRVKVGNYLGSNHGKIIDISEESIGLTEIIPDGQGGWVERNAQLALYQ